MQEKLNSYLQKASRNNSIHNKIGQSVTCLSLIVIICVFWSLKLTGITMAGEACCGISEHAHADQCYLQTLICETPESDDHLHTDECYSKDLICEIQEHLHIVSCYSDNTADIETSEDWELTLSEIQRSPSTLENIVNIATSQIGYTESTLNFEVDVNGVRRGITRYGQWYGNPYGDWSAMFASFCLNYAGCDDVPANAGPESMRLEWESAGLYKNAAEYSPQTGNIIFLNYGTDSEQTETDSSPPTANAVAIITSVTPETITVIQGDYNDTVSEVQYAINDPQILGYALVPENPNMSVLIEPPDDAPSFAKASNFNTSMLSSTDQFVFYVESNGNYYAFDGSGNAVVIYIDDNGNIFSSIDNFTSLLWTFSRYNNYSYAIQNVETGRYLHPYYNSNTDNGITTPGRWGTSVAASGNGLKFNNSAYVEFNATTQQFLMARTSSQNVTFNIGITQLCTVWFDGTNGNIGNLGGAGNSSQSVYTNSYLTLPTEWKSPDKYEYVISGWYDVINKKYYKPGDKALVTGNTVFYADWKAATYDIGQFNASVDNETISTNSYITTKVFDYGLLFNVLSETANVNVSSSGHSETWQLLTSGNNPFNNEPTLNYIFRDWDTENQAISRPNGVNAQNNPTDAGSVYPGLYSETIRNLLFNPEVEIPGKQYLGEGDYLFQICTDPSHDHYGYLYYNSERNAAAYNQSDQRFYVYDYLESTLDSYNNENTYSDFLPLNSPYTNNNGKLVNTFTHSGAEGEYNGTTHYMYDCRISNGSNYSAVNFWFGMSIDVSFYLPNAPATIVSGGGYGNQDLYGRDMHFRFKGDDDVWVLIDGKMVLDLGGIHGSEGGDINFSTGEVTVNGKVHQEHSKALKSLIAGEHTLTLYYLERGASMSNCAIYFNLAPRFDFTIQKEDVLTQDVLNGAQFSVYTDSNCTVPATLWTSKEAHDNGEASTNTFTVVDGVAHMWGMGAGNVYYMKETKPPNNPDYGFPNGIIRLIFDKFGTASYNVEIIDDGSGISPGFIVHGFKIDNETQKAYIVATNAPKWVNETTTVEARKHWKDSLDHSADEVKVYLTITDADGSVRRLQEATLNAENGWYVKWENLPKYQKDLQTLIEYGVEEAYVSGYYSSIEEQETQFVITETLWKNKITFGGGKIYLIKNPSGLYLSTLQSAQDTGFKWVTESEAKESPLALWTASVDGNRVRLTNQANQTLTFYYGNGSPTDFFAYDQFIEDNNRKQYLTYSLSGTDIILSYNSYYLSGSLNSSSKFANTNQYNQALRITPYTEETSVITYPIENEGYLITNTPIQKETSITVTKQWNIPSDLNESVYNQLQITVKLYANGVFTGRTETLSLKNGWATIFRGLPYEDDQHNVIEYSVQEVIPAEKWIASYGEVYANNNEIPQYSTTITNTYRTGGPILPSTGSPARLLYTTSGATIMLISLLYGLYYKHKRKRAPS